MGVKIYGVILDTYLIVKTLVCINDDYVDIESVDRVIADGDDLYGKLRILANDRVVEIEDCIFVFWDMLLQELRYLESNSEISVGCWESPVSISLKYDKSRQFVVIDITNEPPLKVSRDAFISSILTAGQGVIRSIARISPNFLNVASKENELFQAFGINKQ